MILISVKSEVMDVKHQEQSEKGAEKYLLWVKKFHDMSRRQQIGRRPSDIHGRIAYDIAYRTCIPLRIEIINTEANQLCMPELLNPSRIIK